MSKTYDITTSNENQETYFEKIDLLEDNEYENSSVSLEKKYYIVQYMTFCHSYGMVGFPVGGHLKTYLMYSAFTVGYSAAYCNMSYYYIKKYQKLYLNKEVDGEIHNDINETLLLIKKKCPKSAFNKHPCISSDLVYLTKCIPEGWVSKAKMVSYMLVSFNSGARISTVSNLRIGDIDFIETNKLTGEIDKIGFTYRFSKKNGTKALIPIAFKRWDWPRDQDIFYWLDRHLSESYGLSLKTLKPKELDKNTKSLFVWNDTEHLMYNKFRTIVNNAGYPPKYFSPHCFRSGYFCGEFIRAAQNGEVKDNLLFKTALVCEWEEGSDSQIGYLAKPEIIQALLPSKIVHNPDNKEIIIDTWRDPVMFHNLKDPLINKWKCYGPSAIRRFLYKDFIEQLDLDSHTLFINSIKIKRKFGSLYILIMSRYSVTEYRYEKEIKSELKLLKKKDKTFVITGVMNKIIEEDFNKDYEKYYKYHEKNMREIYNSLIESTISSFKSTLIVPTEEDYQLALPNKSSTYYTNDECVLLLKSILIDKIDLSMIRMHNRSPRNLEIKFAKLKNQYGVEILMKVALGEIKLPSSVDNLQCNGPVTLNVSYSNEYLLSKKPL